MSRMRKLQREAIEACRTRGHVMFRWHWYSRHNAVTRCIRCGREVQVLGDPAPNDVDIGGEAVALDCEATKVVSFW